MQESGVDARDAKRHGAQWYLSRNGEQIGPLTERELALFAEGGNFKAGDLLWTAGLDGWKPADAIFASSGAAEEDAAATNEPEDAEFPVDTEDEPGDVTAGNPSDVEGEVRTEADNDIAEPEPAAFPDPGAEHPGAEHLDAAHPGAAHLDVTHFDDAHPEHDPHLDAGHLDGSDPSGEHVHALAQRLKGEAPPLTGKARVVAALNVFAGPAGYLLAIFALLSAYAWLGDAPDGPGLGFFLLTIVNAFVAFQIMRFAERFGFVQGLRQKPLIQSILYKTLAFGTLVFVLYGLELTVIGILGGDGSSAGGSLAGTLALWVVFTVAMVPYFAFKALEGAVGADMIAKLLWGRR